MSHDRSEWDEARQLTTDNAEELAAWCGGRTVEEIGPDGNTPGINVPTLRGVKRASVSDYIILNSFEEFLVVNEYTYKQE